MTRLSTRTTMPDPLGVVLCGGQSSRMGRDKGLISENGKTWAKRAHDVLAEVCDRVIYSVNPRQLAAYQAALGADEIVVDTIADAGPLGGLLSVRQKYPGHDILLLACDMIFVDTEDLRPLVGQKAQIVTYRNAGVFEPLCAYYAAAALEKMSALFSEKKIPLGLQKILQSPEFHTTALEPKNPGHLKSRNEPA